ncbi:MAG: ribonuclease R family protein, partial [Anaerovoracaceae bacterium]
VSHYVENGGFLDKEALKRGTSVYLLDQVIPMLPKALSNDICSLNPNEDRLTLSVDMEITPEGVIVSHEIYESIIKSCERLIYDDISDLLENDDKDMSVRYKDIKNELLMMNDLAIALRKRRYERGSLDFDLDESYIKLDKRGVPISVDIAQRRTANKLIEEFMLIANETVAEHFYWMEIPFVYRVHEKPDNEKIDKLKVFLQSFGIILKGNSDSIHPKAISNILEQVKGKSNENVVSSVTLRSMQKAFYSTSCEGHFGLALKYYCHFTSPIRRYPDLMIHRIIKWVISNEVTSKGTKYFAKMAENAAELSSAAERKAIEAEREVEKLKKAEYMTYHIGEEFDGVISGVTNFGLYVQLENTIEGLIKIDSLYDDYYDYNQEKYALMGRRTNKVYKLGDKIRIFVDDVNTDRSEINFLIAKFK